MPFLNFSDNLSSSKFIVFQKKVVIFLRQHSKHAQFLFGVQFPIKEIHRSEKLVSHIIAV